MNTGPRTFSGTRGFAGRAGRRRRTCASLVLALLGAPLLLVPGCASFPDPQATRGLAEKMVAESYPGMPETLTRRAVQDRAQAICSKVGHAKPTQEEAAEVVRLSRETLKYPASGRLAGDWKAGARLAYAGQGGRIVQGKVEMAKENGALCSNCHALDPGEVNVGNIGPSLTGYGAQRGNSDAVAKLDLREDLQRVGLLPVLQYAAPRSERTSHARADRRRGRVSRRSAVSAEPQMIQPVCSSS